MFKSCANRVMIYRFLIHRYSCVNKCTFQFFVMFFKNCFKTGKNMTELYLILFKNSQKCDWIKLNCPDITKWFSSTTSSQENSIASATNLSSSFMHELAKKKHNFNIHLYNLISKLRFVFKRNNMVKKISSFKMPYSFQRYQWRVQRRDLAVRWHFVSC